jgi:hypothetical protein
MDTTTNKLYRSYPSAIIFSYLYVDLIDRISLQDTPFSIKQLPKKIRLRFIYLYGEGHHTGGGGVASGNLGYRGVAGNWKTPPVIY